MEKEDNSVTTKLCEAWVQTIIEGPFSKQIYI